MLQQKEMADEGTGCSAEVFHSIISPLIFAFIRLLTSTSITQRTVNVITLLELASGLPFTPWVKCGSTAGF